MSNVDTTTYVDHSALRTNQAFIIALLLIAFITGFWPLTAFVAAVMLIGTLLPGLALFQRIYRHALRPTGLVRPDRVPDSPAPHRFAQGMGGTFTLASAVLLATGTGAPAVGWAFSWLVILLAALNLFVGFCAGCFVYYRLERLGVPGFQTVESGGGSHA
jgi:hypothetical protein